MNNVNVDFDTLEVDKSNENVSYNDLIHAYWTKDTKERCISVTTLLHKYTTFDEGFWSKYKAIQRLLTEDVFDGPIIGKQTIKGVKKDKRGPASDIKKKLLDAKVINYDWLTSYKLTQEQVDLETETILKEWADKRDTSCIRGTAIHKEQEMRLLAGNCTELKHYDLGGKFKSDSTNKVKPGEQNIYPELLLSYISPDGKLRIAGQADLIIIDGFDVFVLDYKGLPLDTPIATRTGWSLMKDLKIGDEVFDRDGEITKIKHVSEIHNNPCYKITFDNSESIVCDHEHKWVISFRKKKGVYKDVEMTTEELKKYLDSIENRNSNNIPRIINAKPLNLPKLDLPLDPYVLGAWLGDGSKQCGAITNINPDFWNEIRRRGYKLGDDISGENRAEYRTVLGISTELRKLNLLGNKHIPDMYLRSSYEQRLDLLRGLMDTDGHYHTKRNRYVMRTSQLWQCDGLIQLLSSLGIKPTKFNVNSTCNGEIFPGYDVCFYSEENPFLIRNKEGARAQKKDNATYRNIESIEKVETVPTRCIAVDSPSRTYLAGYSMIPTHNTNESIDKDSYYDSKKKQKQMLKYPLNNVIDANFWHYSLQLSTYALMLQQLDPRFNIKGLLLIHFDHQGGTTTYECEYLKDDVKRMLNDYKRQCDYEEFNRKNEKVIF